MALVLLNEVTHDLINFNEVWLSLGDIIVLSGIKIKRDDDPVVTVGIGLFNILRKICYKRA